MGAVGFLMLTLGVVSQCLQHLHSTTVRHRHHADSACQQKRYAQSLYRVVCVFECDGPAWCKLPVHVCQRKQGYQLQGQAGDEQKKGGHGHQLGVPCAGTVTTSEAGCVYTVTTTTVPVAKTLNFKHYFVVDLIKDWMLERERYSTYSTYSTHRVFASKILGDAPYCANFPFRGKSEQKAFLSARELRLLAGMNTNAFFAGQ